MKVKKAAILILFISISVSVLNAQERIIINPDLEVVKIAENIWLHCSYLDIEPWGRTGANGLIIAGNGYIAVIDTPWTDRQAEDLIAWIKRYFKKDIKYVIPTHFHDDNLGGLNAFKAEGIESWSLDRTIDICIAKGLPVPENGFSGAKTLVLEPYSLEMFFPGEGHTVDNISVRIHGSPVLFGGCLIKAMNNQTLGNLADANVDAWAESCRNLKKHFSNAQIIIPGHGTPGSMELIDHTIDLADEYQAGR